MENVHFFWAMRLYQSLSPLFMTSAVFSDKNILVDNHKRKVAVLSQSRVLASAAIRLPPAAV